MIDMELKQREAQARYAASQCVSNDPITQRAKMRHASMASALGQLIAIRSAVRKATLRTASPFSCYNL